MSIEIKFIIHGWNLLHIIGNSTHIVWVLMLVGYLEAILVLGTQNPNQN